jgi:hypothetical protein
MPTAFIYVLLDPIDGKPRYPGKANDPTSRLKDHLKDAKNGGHYHIHRWLRKLLKYGLLPVQRILEIVPEGVRWQEREKYWIRYFKKRGYKLLNHTDGGDGGATNRGRKCSDEQKKKISWALCGKSKSKEHNQHNSEAHRGPRKPHSREARRNMSIAAGRRDNSLSIAHLRKLAAARVGTHRSEQSNQKTSNSMKRVWLKRKAKS